MKKLVLFICLLTFSCLAYFDPTPVKPEGEGTQETPYLFKEMGNFVWFAKNYNNIEHGPIVYCVQIKDIDASESTNWWRFPAVKTSGFVLNYDGQGFSIKNLCIGWCDNEAGGLFARGAFQLKNINLIEAEQIRPQNNVGLLIGELYAGKDKEAYVSNCHVQGKTTDKCASAFIGCVTVGKGGKVEIRDCSVDAEIKDGPAGLITSVNNYGTFIIKNTSSLIKYTIDHNAGWYGDVKAAGFINSFLLYKGSKTIVEDCYSDVEINCKDKYTCASGFIGELFNQDHRDRVDVEVSRCYSTGTINKTNGWASAAFISVVDNLYTNEETIVIKDCYYNASSFKKFKKSEKYALPKTEEELKQQATFENWDFENVWAIDEGNGFPYLRKAEVEKRYPKLLVNYNGTGKCTVDNGVVKIEGGSDKDTLAISGLLGNRCQVKNIVTEHGLKKIKVTGDLEGMQVAGKVGALLVNRGNLGKEGKDFALIFDADNAVIKVKGEKGNIAKGSKAAGTIIGGDIKGNILCGTRDEAGNITTLGTVKKMATLGGNIENGKVVAERVGKVTAKPKGGKGGKVINFTTETE